MIPSSQTNWIYQQNITVNSSRHASLGVCVWLKGNKERPHIQKYTRNFPEELDGSDYTNAASDVYFIID